MISLHKRIKEWLARFLEGYPQREFGITDEQFFVALLESVPPRSTVGFYQYEPETWIDRLRPWSFRSNEKQLEADHYQIDDSFLGEIRELVRDDPSTVVEIHHLAISSPEGDLLFGSFDNFSPASVFMDESLKAGLRKRLTSEPSAS